MKVGTGKVYDLVRRHKIPHKKIGTRIIFSEADVLAWFQSLPNGTLPDLGPLPKPEVVDVPVEEDEPEKAPDEEVATKAAEREPLKTSELSHRVSTALKANGHTRPIDDEEPEEAKVRTYLTRDQVDLLIQLIDDIDREAFDTPYTRTEVEEMVAAAFTMKHALLSYDRFYRNVRGGVSKRR